MKWAVIWLVEYHSSFAEADNLLSCAADVFVLKYVKVLSLYVSKYLTKLYFGFIIIMCNYSYIAHNIQLNMEVWK